MRITTDDGVELAVEVAGEGPGLLLVHGFGGAKEDFTDHVPALARDHTVVIFDHRGHGESDKPTEPAAYSLARLVADTLQVADAAGLDHFRLLGYSMGGMVACKLVLGSPERVDALIMMDTAAGPVPGFDPALFDIAADVAINEGKEKLKELLDFAQVLQTPAYKRVLVERTGYDEFQARKWAGVSAVMWGTIAYEFGRQTDDLPALAAELRCPLLIIVGEQDTGFLEASRLMADAIAASQLVVIRDAGHSPQFENPDAWYDTLQHFLASVSAPAPT
jgi:pimeloyl-ACP methyl ester carboxylesterase